VALGPEYRNEKLASAADPLSLANGPGLGTAYYIGNFQPINGGYSVAEGFVETGIPLAKDVAWAKRLDLSGAVRVTGYSTFGTVTTWKAGAVYQPIDDLKFRVTRSRDIRAPNFNEAFSKGVNGRTPLTDRLLNQVYSTVNSALGNPNLLPEKSTTQTEGGTYAPSWLPGLTMSFDYYDINIKGGISSLGAQGTIDQCAAGVQVACSSVVRGSDGLISVVYVTPQNYASIHAKGFDVDAGYHFRLDDIFGNVPGNIQLRFSGSRSITLTTNNGVQTTQAVGQYSNGAVAPWRWFSSLSYNYEAATLTVMNRGLSGGRWDNAWVGCTSGCPAATSLKPTVNNNYIPGRSYFDLSAAYKVMRNETAEVEVFMTIDNILDTDPPQASATLSQYGWTPNANTALFDVLGRVFRAGVRFKM
jgi:outer membrane receptor protein involved in Fe transport